MEYTMREPRSILVGVLFTFLAAASPAQDANEATVTYIANSGFLVSYRGKAILIDALFNQGFGEYLVPSSSLKADMIAGKAPFTRIDALLVTHSDPDHFSASDTVAFLKRHPETRLFASPMVCGLLSGVPEVAKQIHPIVVPSDGKKLVKIGDALTATAFRLKHTDDGSDMRMNLGYLVSFDGVKAFFTGDTTIEISQKTMKKINWRKEKVDLFFIQNFDLLPFSRSFIEKTIRPRHLIATHVPVSGATEKTQFMEAYPSGIVFEKTMDSLRLPVGGGK
jgi:L-ascorbate metabolism protein UlaG (beta-lactamase superfamily)